MGPEILDKVNNCDELWHGGDWGDMTVSDQLPKDLVVRGVYGNIDGHEVRKCYPKELYFELEGLKVYMIHIGGFPTKYTKEVKAKLQELKPDLYICGHSHILKVIRDNALGLVHFNPGAIGMKGFHTKRTMMRFAIKNGKLIDIEVLEYDRNKE